MDTMKDAMGFAFFAAAIALWLFLEPANAQDRPVPLDPVEGQCLGTSEEGLDVGDTYPEHLIDAEGVSQCAVVVLPTSMSLDLAAWVAYAKRLESELETSRKEVTHWRHKALAKGTGWKMGAACAACGAAGFGVSRL